MENFYENKSWYHFSPMEAKASKSSVYIYDDIGVHGITAKGFIEDLKKLKGKDVVVHINSSGGDVFQGQAIYTALNNYSGHVTVKIEGLAASMASIIALAADKVEMTSNSLFMIHSPMGTVFGNKTELRRKVSALEKVESTMLGVYRSKTNLEENKLEEMMTSETWLSAPEALEMGFVDEIIGAVKVVAKYDVSGYANKTPEQILETLNNSKEKNTMTEEFKTWFQTQITEIKTAFAAKADPAAVALVAPVVPATPNTEVADALTAKIAALEAEKETLTTSLNLEKEKGNENKASFTEQNAAMAVRIAALEAAPSTPLAGTEPNPLPAAATVVKDSSWDKMAKEMTKN